MFSMGNPKTSWGHHVHDISGLLELIRIDAKLLFPDEGPLEVVVTFHKGLYKAKVIRQDMTKVPMAGKEADFECKALQNLHEATAEKLFWCLESRIAETCENARRAEMLQKLQEGHVEGSARDSELEIQALVRGIEEMEEALILHGKETVAACDNDAMKIDKHTEEATIEAQDSCGLRMKFVADNKVLTCDASESIENGWSVEDWDRQSI